MAEPNNAAMYDARRRQGGSGSKVLDNIVSTSNCMSLLQAFYFVVFSSRLVVQLTGVCAVIVDRDEVDRLRKRFMKLDRVSTLCTL